MVKVIRMRLNDGNGKYPEWSLRDFYSILFRHKRKVIIFSLTAMVTVTLGTLLADEIYKSEAKLLIRIGRESVTLDPTVTTGQVISIGQSRESEINSELEILRSRELAQRVVEDLGPKIFLERTEEGGVEKSSSRWAFKEWLQTMRKSLKKVKREFMNLLKGFDLSPPLSSQEKAVNKFMENLKIETQKNTNILFLSYENRSPPLAQSVLAKLIDIYQDKHIATHRTAGSYEFFARQADQVNSQMTQKEEELKRLKSKTGMTSLEEQMRILLTRIGALQQEEESNQAALVISNAKVKDLKRKLANISPTLVIQKITGTGNHAADLMRSRLYELQLKEQDLRTKFADDSEPMRQIRRQIAEAQVLLAQEDPTRTQVTTGINPAHQQLSLDLIKEKVNLSSLEAKARVLKTHQDLAHQELTDWNENEVQMVQMRRELSLLEAKYHKYSENLEQARIDQALEINKISNISVVQPAMVSMIPVRPKKLLNLALGFFLGVVGGIGLAFCFEYLDQSVKSPQDVQEKLSLPLLASIPCWEKELSHLSSSADRIRPS